MNPRRAALLGRFRSSALHRLATVGRVIADARDSGEAAAPAGVLGDLHTIKGEARMLGLAGLSRFVHALEQALSSTEVMTADELAGAAQAVALLERVLRGELGDDQAGGAVLDAAAARLEEGASGFDERAFAPSGGAQPTAPTGPAPDGRWTHVEAGRVDRVCELVTEVVWMMDRVHSGLRDLARSGGAVAANLRDLVQDTERSLPQLRELEHAAWALRLVPVEPVLRDLEHHGRDLATRLDKRVRFELDGAGTQLERQVLDRLAEPLLHLLRNAIDHGIEAPAERGDKPGDATVRITAESAGAAVHIIVEDDGRGIDFEQVKVAAVERGLLFADDAARLPEHRAFDLLFAPGFSTRRDVTELSGRGLGLEVVRRRIEEVGGTIAVDSIAGFGTRFAVTVPATMTRERFLLVQSGDALYGIPSKWVRRVTHRDRAVEEAVAGGYTTRDERGPVPLRTLDADLGAPASELEPGTLLWMETPFDSWAWAVPVVVGERDLVRRAVDPVLAVSGVLSGSAINDDGRLVLLIGVVELIRRAQAHGAVAAHTPATSAARRPAPRVLVVDDSPIIRGLLVELLSEAGLRVETAADGAEALASIERDPPDLVVTDLEMPVMDGFALLEAVRRRSPHLPVVVVTTRGSEEDRRRASALGANAYLVKTGFEGRTLLETVGRFVDVAA